MIRIKGNKQELVSAIYGTLMAHEVSKDVETLIIISEDIISDLQNC